MRVVPEFWLVPTGGTTGSHSGPCPVVVHYGLCTRQSDFGRGSWVGKGFNFSLVLNFEHDKFKILMRHPRNVKKAAACVGLGSKESSRLGV